MDNTGEYLPRIIDTQIAENLAASGAVLIEGPKWCGKTWSARHIAHSVLYMQDPDKSANYLQIAKDKPSLLLDGEPPLLIDEWQTAPVLWDAVRFAVDTRGRTGQFLLTGSAVPLDDAVMHTGTGRIARLYMRPMSLYESGESNGTVSLRELFEGAADISGTSKLTIENLAFILSRGGWPASVTDTKAPALQRVKNYINAVVNYDVSRVDGVEKNPDRVRVLLQSLARNTASMATLGTITADVSANDGDVSEKTISKYLTALRRIFVIEDLPAWRPALRSKTMIRSSPKRHFVDPSLAAAVLRATPERLLKDFPTFGIFFESLCVRDLRIYASAADAMVYHYHDANGLEADAVVQMNDGRWGAIEIKLGTSEVADAAANLLTLKDRINTEKMNAPAFLMVLTGIGEFAYQRDDGVYVVPVGCLGP